MWTLNENCCKHFPSINRENLAGCQDVDWRTSVTTLSSKEQHLTYKSSQSTVVLREIRLTLEHLIPDFGELLMMILNCKNDSHRVLDHKVNKWGQKCFCINYGDGFYWTPENPCGEGKGDWDEMCTGTANKVLATIVATKRKGGWGQKYLS